MTEAITILAILGFVGFLAILVIGVGREKTADWDQALIDLRKNIRKEEDDADQR